MKFGFYDNFRPCLVKGRGVVDITDLVGLGKGVPPQAVLENLIKNYAKLLPKLKALEANGKAISFSKVRLRSPVPRPGKVLCGERNYMEDVPIKPIGPMKSFFKSPEGIVGPGDNIVLPKFQTRVYNHEAELGIIIGKKAKNIAVKDALKHVFGYTNAVDVSARQPSPGEAELPGSYGKCFDTFLPVGPFITTANEIKNPNKLRVRYWVNKKLRQDYNTSDMEHGIAFFIATLSHCMTLMPGDLLLAGTNHSHLGPLQNGDMTEIEIAGLGRTANPIKDSLKRKWKVELRNPQDNKDRRQASKGKPHGGTWPFQKPYAGK